MEAVNYKSMVAVKALVLPHQEKIFTGEALEFIAALHEQFDARRKELLAERKLVQQKLDAGWRPHFLPETRQVREGEWTVAPLPSDLLDRRVEITGPVERKMMINALNSGAKVFMADLEDSASPTWVNVCDGQVNLYDAVRKTIAYENPENGKKYTLNNEVAVLMIRPRGLHLEEKHVYINGKPASGSLVDFGLYFFHNAHALMEQGSAPYFYLPKLEDYREARWWNQVFEYAQHYLGIAKGTIKATVLVETILAPYQLDEILYELRQHSAGLNCGRWDYIFSFIKKFHRQPGFVFPDRDQITMTVPFMRAYSQLVIKTCHRRHVHAMGGMAAQIPVKNDEAANVAAFEKVKADKLREVTDGHDGTWVAHPALVAVAMDVFNEHMPAQNQLEKQLTDLVVTEEELIAVPEGTITEQGVRKNINVGIQYLAAWLSGNGAAAIFNLMEDAATAEISRTQVWQWLKLGVTLDDGRIFTSDLYAQLLDEETAKLEGGMLPAAWKPNLGEAAGIFNSLVRDAQLKEFLTTEAYTYLPE